MGELVFTNGHCFPFITCDVIHAWSLYSARRHVVSCKVWRNTSNKVKESASLCSNPNRKGSGPKLFLSGLQIFCNYIIAKHLNSIYLFVCLLVSPLQVQTSKSISGSTSSRVNIVVFFRALFVWAVLSTSDWTRSLFVHEWFFMYLPI